MESIRVRPEQYEYLKKKADKDRRSIVETLEIILEEDRRKK